MKDMVILIYQDVTMELRIKIILIYLKLQENQILF